MELDYYYSYEEIEELGHEEMQELLRNLYEIWLQDASDHIEELEDIGLVTYGDDDDPQIDAAWDVLIEAARDAGMDDYVKALVSAREER